MTFPEACHYFWVGLMCHNISHTVTRKADPEIDIYVHNGDYKEADEIGKKLGFTTNGEGKYILE